MFRGCGSGSRPAARRFFSYLSFVECKPRELPLTLHARPKERRAGTVKLAELRAVGRTPICVVTRVPTLRHNPANIHATIASRTLTREIKKGEIQSRVYNVKVPGKKSMLATVGHLYTEGPHNTPQFVLFNEFVPGRRTKIAMPVNIKNMELCAAIRKGADFRYGPTHVPMYWRGDHRIPRSISLDLEGATPDIEFAIAQDAGVLPEGLSMRFPKRIYTLASLRSTRKYDGLAEELDADSVAEAAQAEADAAAKKAKAAKPADTKAGDAKAGAPAAAAAAPKKK